MEIAAIPVPVMLQELGRRHIPSNYALDDLRQDVATLKNLA